MRPLCGSPQLFRGNTALRDNVSALPAAPAGSRHQGRESAPFPPHGTGRSSGQGRRKTSGRQPRALKRMDNVGIVVEDLAAAIDFFRELGLTLEGRAMIEGA